MWLTRPSTRLWFPQANEATQARDHLASRQGKSTFVSRILPVCHDQSTFQIPGTAELLCTRTASLTPASTLRQISPGISSLWSHNRPACVCTALWRIKCVRRYDCLWDHIPRRHGYGEQLDHEISLMNHNALMVATARMLPTSFDGTRSQEHSAMAEDNF